MDILFKKKKLGRICNSRHHMIKEFGPRRADLLRRRLDDMRAASTLQDLSTLPQTRCHELKGNRAGQLSVDLDHPYRLIFEPADVPIAWKPDGGLDWSHTRTIRILGVEDTHE